ncbi:MAG: DUF4350 domain-containing protein [Burkholderiales bacterium]
MKKPLIIATAVALCLALGGWFVFTFFEITTQKIWVGYHGEAAKQRFLAAERFLESNGIKTARASTIAALNPTASRSLVILSTGRQALLNDEVDQLLAWVHAGNHLIVAPEAVALGDAILDRLQIQRGGVPQTRRDRRGKRDESIDSSRPGGDAEPPQLACRPDERVTEVALPGTPEKLHIEFGRQPTLMLDPNQVEHMWTGASGIQMASLRIGSGRVTVMPLGIFTNSRIGHFDHAALLHALVTWERDIVAVTIIDRLNRLSLARWIIEHAMWVIIGLLILILFWLWRAMVRFGPIAPDPSVARRSLIDHLAAAGRFQWRIGDRDNLIAAAREQAIAHAMRVIPGFSLLAPAEQSVRLAAIATISPGEANHVIAGVVRTPAELMALTELLRRIHVATARGIRATHRTDS